MAKTPMGGSQDDPQFETGHNPKPTRSRLQDREASPAKYNTSGMESAMGNLADKTHKR
jgi:hypothetical protein